MESNLTVGIWNILGAVGLLAGTQGKVIHCKPRTGSDDNTGSVREEAVKTLDRALDLATANQNDIIMFYAEHNDTSAYTTDYQSATLDWNKDMVHLVGVGAPSPFSPRQRIAFASAYNTASNLFTLSADACLIFNIGFFAGVAGANPTGCFQATGDRNVIAQCHIAGIGNNANDIAGAYSLYLNGAEENLFKDCRIGLNTVDAGTAANSEILIANQAKNIIFDNSLIYRRIEHATNHPLVKIAAATSIEEAIFFRNGCGFASQSTNHAFSNASVFKFVAQPTQGLIYVDPTCWATNGKTAGKWDVGDYDAVVVTGSPTPAADTAQIGRYV